MTDDFDDAPEVLPSVEADKRLDAAVRDSYVKATTPGENEALSTSTGMDSPEYKTAMMKVWNKNNGPEAHLRDPQPLLPPGLSDLDRWKATQEFKKSPIESQRNQHRAKDAVGAQIQAAAAIRPDLECKSWSDFGVIRSILGKDQKPTEQQPQLPKDYEPIRSVIDRYQDTFQRNELHPADGIARLLDVEDQLAHAPAPTTLDIARAYGVTWQDAINYCTEEDLAELASALQQRTGQVVAGAPAQHHGQQQAHAYYLLYQSWADGKGVTPEMRAAMSEIAQEFPGETNPLRLLDKCLHELKRRQMVRGKRSLGGRVSDAVEGAAAEIGV
jgi:hypothetical protein